MVKAKNETTMKLRCDSCDLADDVVVCVDGTVGLLNGESLAVIPENVILRSLHCEETRDGKRPNGLTLIPWQGGKPLCWDVMVACPVANSYIQTAIGFAGAVAEMAATGKSTKYGALESQPIALESLGPMNSDARQFLSNFGRRISRSSGDDRETSFLFQHISVLLFRFNSVLLHDGFVLDDRPEQ